MNLSNINTNARIPIIPLPNELSHLKERGELIIDDKNKKILVVDREDSSIVHDLTDWIVSHIDNINGDLIYVEIDGFGPIELKKILNIILEKIDSQTIEATDISDVSYFLPDGTIDNKSLKSNSSVLEINGFANANDNTVPMKNGNTIEWVNINSIPGNDNDNPNIGDGNNSGNGNDSDSSIDVAYGNVYDVVPQNNVLYPIISERQQSLFLSGNHTVILPKSIYSYIRVEWFILTGDTTLTLIYNNNILFKNSEFNKFKPNSMYKISFISYDKGKNWISEIVTYENKYLGGE